MGQRAAGIDSIPFSRWKYGRELTIDAWPLERWRGIGRPDRSHRFDFYEILLVEEGSGRMRLDTEDIGIAAPTILVTAPGQVRRVELERPLDGQLIVFAPDALGRQTRLAPHSGALAVTRESMTRLNEVSNAMRSELNSPQLDTPAMLQVLLAQCLILADRVAARKRRSSPTPELLIRLESLVDARFRVEHRAAAYASALGVTLDHLSSIARQHGRGSVKEIVRNRIHSEARRLLIHTGMNVAEVAYAVGYSDPAHFARAFKHATGCAPGRFRAGITDSSR